ncbi:MAG: hypothetical protein KC431_24975 [Myxococcales bacterium]|nr:hypothetical protein [Myxococcales bacterium]
MNKPSNLAEIACLLSCLCLGTILGCRVTLPNPEHCYYAQGDETCAERFPELPYCADPSCSAAPYGCVAEEPTPECHSPCGVDDLSCLGDTDETTTSTSSDDTEQACRFDSECPDEQPLCNYGQCTTCDQTNDPAAACERLDELRPICLGSVCVACTAEALDVCVDAAQACDLESNSCVPCTTHDQCPRGAACDLELGACLPPDAVWHVNGDGSGDFSSISDALEAVGSGSATLIVHQTDGGYPESTVLTGKRTVAILAAPGERPRLVPAGAPSLVLSEEARVYLRGMVLVGDRGVTLSSDSLLHVDASTIMGQLSDTLVVHGSTLVLRNAMVRGGLELDEPAIVLGALSEIRVVYSTIVAVGSGPAIECVLPAPLWPDSSFVRNSLLGNFDADEPSLAPCGAIEFADSVTSLPAESVDWFVDPLQGDLHVNQLVDFSVSQAARWMPGDPTVDYDGDPRPAREGSVDFAGADRLP